MKQRPVEFWQSSNAAVLRKRDFHVCLFR